MATRLYSYRPALDGIRGYLMIAFLLWHVGVLPFLPGLWIAMNLFFVLSAFLITRLLLAEHRRYGNISVREFYGRRVRRLLPALLVMLSAVTIDGVFFAPATEKNYLKGDIVSSLFYVMNWRLVLRDDPYFEDFTHPSITRHAWSLSVEEQFYLLVPLLLGLVIAHLASRLSRTLVFVVLALLSAAWASTIALDSLRGQAHAYYGTDVRVQALAVGVAVGMWTGHVGAGRKLLRSKDVDGIDGGSRVPEMLGWLGWAGLLAGFVFIEPLASWMFTRGGMLVFCLVAAAYVVGCAQRRPTPLVRIHSLPPLVYVGRISYGVYVYHWPIYLWMRRGLPHTNNWVLALITLAVSLGAAAVSYRYLEQPVIRHGWRAFGHRGRPAQAATAAGLAVVLGGAMTMTGASATATPDAPAQVPQYVENIPQLVAGQPAYREPKPAARIAMFGDSVPYFLTQRIPHRNFPGLDLTNMGTPGCDLLSEPVQWTPTQQQTNDGPCAEAKKAFVTTLKRSSADTLVIMPSLLMALRHDVGGKVVWLDDAVYRDRIEAEMTHVVDQAHEAGVTKVVMTTVPCRRIEELQVPEQFRAEFDRSPKLVAAAQDPTKLNAILTAWAAEHGVGVVDLAKPICGSHYEPVLHGKTLYDDGIHFSPQATPMIWGWLAPQILAKAGRA